MGILLTSQYHSISEGTITVGCDPEFLFVAPSRRVRNARDLLGNVTITLPGDNQSNLGWDGASTPGEIRPRYSIHAVNVVATIGALFKCLSTKEYVQNLELWSGNGTSGVPTGGHIHLGGFGRNFNILPTISTVLDTFLLPIGIALSTPTSTIGRIRTGYGSWNQYRQQDWGVEYRSLPSWLYHPMTALFFLQAAKGLVVSLIDGNLDGESMIQLGSPPTSITSHAPRFFLESAIRGMQKRALLSLDQLADLPCMNTKTVREAVLFIEDMLRHQETWEERNILPNWLSIKLSPEFVLPHVNHRYTLSSPNLDTTFTIEYQNTPFPIGTTPNPITSRWSPDSPPPGVAGSELVIPSNEVLPIDDNEDDDDDNVSCEWCGLDHDEHDCDDWCPRCGTAHDQYVHLEEDN